MPAPEERWWLPKGNWIYGYAEFDLAPPHNEPDPELLRGQFGELWRSELAMQPVRALPAARKVTVRPFGKTALRRVKIFWDPTFVFGKNVPQFLYTWSWQGIGWRTAVGSDVYLGRASTFA